MISDFFAEQNLSFDHVKSLAAGMFAVAKADGVHDREMALIREFYEGCARTGDPQLADVVGNFDVNAAKSLFDTPESAKLFVKSLILLAFADGTYAQVEDDLIRKIGGDMGVSGEDVDNLHAATKEYLLASLAHVQNVDALTEVAKRLSL